MTIDNVIGVQKFHTAPTPRVGGVAIGFALLIFTLFLSGSNKDIFTLVIVSSIPMVTFGFIEDITGEIGPKIRLFAALISGFIFVNWSGYIVSNIQFPILNRLFLITPIAIIITTIALAGLANAVNIIDGYHGLACGSVAIMFSAFAMLAYRAEDYPLVAFAIAHMAATIGFMLVNFPFGRLFLGDGGAYYLGFALGVNIVMLIERNHEISPWTAIIVLAYPLIETLYSMYRKWLTPGHRPDRPDRIHFHHLLYRSQVSPRLNKYGLKTYANPVSGALMWSFPILSAICAQIGFGNIILSVVMFFGLIALYLISYATLGFLATRKQKVH